MLKGLSNNIVARRECWNSTVTLQRHGVFLFIHFEDFPKTPEKFEPEPASPINGNLADEEATDWELKPKARA